MNNVSRNKQSYLLNKISSMFNGFRFKMIDGKGYYQGPGLKDFKPFCNGGHSKDTDIIMLKDSSVRTYTFEDDYPLVFFIGIKTTSYTTQATFSLSKFDTESTSPISSKTLATPIYQTFSYTREGVAIASTTNIHKGTVVSTTANQRFYVFAIPKDSYIRVNTITTFLSGGMGYYRLSNYDNTTYWSLQNMYGNYDVNSTRQECKARSIQTLLLFAYSNESTANNPLNLKYNGEEVKPIYYEQQRGRTCLVYVKMHPHNDDIIQLYPVTKAQYTNGYVGMPSSFLASQFVYGSIAT